VPVRSEDGQQGWLDLIARQPDVAQLMIVERTKVVPDL
jgi:hypothetical protein